MRKASTGGFDGRRMRIWVPQLGRKFFVGVKRQNPVAGTLGERKVLLRGKTRPLAREHHGPERAGNLDSAVGRTGIDDNNFIRETTTGQSPAQVAFFVERDDGYRKQRHAGVISKRFR